MIGKNAERSGGSPLQIIEHPAYSYSYEMFYFVTFTVTVLLFLPLVMVILTLPAFFAVIRPVLETVATFLSSVFYFTLSSVVTAFITVARSNVSFSLSVILLLATLIFFVATFAFCTLTEK